jgi:hypothetical protein
MSKKTFVQIPPNWATMTEAERHDATFKMAQAIQRGAGVPESQIAKEPKPLTPKQG